MTLVPYRRGLGLPSLRAEMDDLFGSFFDYMPVELTEPRFLPSIDINEEENQIVVRAEVPGCKAEDINIDVKGNILTISGEKKQFEEKKEKNCYCSERVYGSFRREVSLPSEVETEKIEAITKDGVLTITMPKTGKSKSLKIKVKEE
jgi:HSP20 family protein